MSTTPSGLGASGRRLWRKITEDLDPEPADYEILRAACETLSELDKLTAAMATAEPFVQGSTGQVKMHPGYNEVRLHRATLALLLGKLEVEPASVEQSPEAVWRSQRASDAAKARWAYQRQGLANDAS